MKILSRKGKPNKVQCDYTLADIYKDYLKYFDFERTKSNFIDVSEVNPVSPTMFKKINMRLYEMIFEKVLLESTTVGLPFKLGELRVQKKKMPVSFLKTKGKLKMDYKYWRETGKLKYHLNEHRNYHRYKLYWAYANIVNIKSYRLEPIRKWHRMLSNILFTKPNIDYFE
jgi:hypothetical protein